MRGLINLLPPDLKQEYGYARRNSSLMHMLAMFGVGVMGLVVIVLAGLMYLQQSSKVYTAQAADIEKSLQDQNQSAVEKQVQDISNSLKLAVQVLSKEVLFSQMLKQMAIIIPSNASLSDISISQLEGGVDITAKTVDYNAATQLQVNLSDPENKIFSKADIVSVTCGPTTSNGVRVKYPCTATIRALFSPDTPFLFINDKAGT
jgi:Tfp pilus assembly protein PilN